MIAALREARPEMGHAVAIDGSDLPAYANGYKHVGNTNGRLRTRFAGPRRWWVTVIHFHPQGRGAQREPTLNCDSPAELDEAITAIDSERRHP